MTGGGLKLPKISIHEGFYMSSCALCGTGIKNGGSIKMQRSLIHEDQGSKCGKVAMTGIKLKLHGSRVQEGRGFQCRLCGVEINKPANLIEQEGGWCRLINFKCDPCGTGDFKHVKMKSHRTAEHIKEVNEDSVEVNKIKPEKRSPKVLISLLIVNVSMKAELINVVCVGKFQRLALL